MKANFRIDANGDGYWNGRKLDFARWDIVLDWLCNIESSIESQILGELEKLGGYDPAKPLPITSLLPNFTGIQILASLIERFAQSLPPDSLFDDRIGCMPPCPRVVPPLRVAKLPRAASLEHVELAERQHQRAVIARQAAIKEREVERQIWKESVPDFRRRIAANSKHALLLKVKDAIERAKMVIDRSRSFSSKIQQGLDSRWQLFCLGETLRPKHAVFIAKWLEILGKKPLNFELERFRAILKFRPEGVLLDCSPISLCYTIFLFPGGRAVAESPFHGNALYYFERDWMQLAQMKRSVLRDLVRGGDKRIGVFVHIDDRPIAPWLAGRLGI